MASSPAALGTALILATGLGLTACGGERYIQVEAEIARTSFLRDAGGKTKESRNEFFVVCTVGTNTWSIENDFPGSGREKWLFDGTNVYNSLQMTQPTPAAILANAARKGFGTVPFEVGRSNITIEIDPAADGCPLGDAGVNIPWLAFCSAPFLRKQGRIIPLPIAALRWTPDGFGYSDTTTLSVGQPGLPRSVELLTSKSLYANSVTRFNERGFIDPEKARSPKSRLPDGLTKFRYVATDWTNFEGWNVPLGFEYTQYDLRENGEVTPVYTGTGSVKSVRFAAKLAGVFAPEMQQMVIDHRLRSEPNSLDNVMYASTRASAAPTNDAQLQEILAARVAEVHGLATPGHHRTGARRWVILLLLVVAAAIPLVLVVFERNRQTKLKNNENG